jgi:hypothetical protein
VVSAWPDGKYRTFCTGCCRTCLKCKVAAFRQQWDETSRFCWGCSRAAGTDKKLVAAPKPSPLKTLKNASIGQYFKAAAAAPATNVAAAARARRVLITGDDDGPRMSGMLYADMRRIVAAVIIKHFGLDVRTVVLVGSGWIWCEHLATDLYASGSFRGLEVFQQARSAPDRVADYNTFYAKAFPRKSQGPTFSDEKKAHITVHRHFTSEKQRINRMVSGCDFIIALSWPPPPPMAAVGDGLSFVQLPAWNEWHSANPFIPRSRAVHISLSAVADDPGAVMAHFLSTSQSAPVQQKGVSAPKATARV